MTDEQEARWRETVNGLREIWFAMPAHVVVGKRQTLGSDKVWKIQVTEIGVMYSFGWARHFPQGNTTRYWVTPEVYSEAMLRYAAKHGITPQWAATCVASSPDNHREAAREVLLASLPRQAQLLLEMHNQGVLPLPIPGQ